MRQQFNTITKLPTFKESQKQIELEAIKYLPKLEDFGFYNYNKDKRSVLEFVGGEDAALDRLKSYIQSGCLD